MPRSRSPKVHELKANLIWRIRDGFHQPGERFLSNRAVAGRFGISYQTAHRLIAELCREGWLERRAASGTYIAGQRETLRGVQLCFHPRARRPGSFGAYLLRLLTEKLDTEKIPWEVTWVKGDAIWKPSLFPVLWECPQGLTEDGAPSGYALLFNNTPSPGLGASRVDSVSTDDHSGGAAAAQMFLRRFNPASCYAVLAGPEGDLRSRNRVAGFVSILPKAKVVAAESWNVEDGLAKVPRLLQGCPEAVFCCSDRLAEAVIKFCRNRKLQPPALIGFDDAPVAEILHLTTIAIPWRELVEGAVVVIKKRLRGDSSTASRQIYAPRPVVRGG